jgi:beta-lactamase superfamily II metal-dependent hydrolase
MAKKKTTKKAKTAAASKNTKKKKTKVPAAGGTGLMEAPDSGVRVRMYRQGHGDCFLLAFANGGARPVYVLIDCGYKPGSNIKFGLKSIDEIVESIKQATGSRLDLVIVTHEHQDHVNGFWKANDPYFEDFTIGAAWFAWTESPTDPLAIKLRKRHGDQLLGLVAARNRLAAAGDVAATQRIDELLSFELGVEAPAQFAAAAKDPEKSINKQAIKLIKGKAGKKNTKYIKPHNDILQVPAVKGVRVFALGPPYDENLLSDEDPVGSEAFPGHGIATGSARASFFAAAKAADDPASVQNIQPFAKRFALPLEQAFRPNSFFARCYGNTDDPPGSGASLEEAAPNAAWRRIDSDWLYSAEELALVLNKGINNTSLVLAFELPKTKKVLLFIGDAQRGNWKSWTKGSWKSGEEKISVRDLMARTVLYKVGHHASHNATLSGTTADDYPNLSWMGQGKYADEFTAMITAVKKWAYAVKPNPWRHPLPSIRTALEEKTAGRLFQTDTGTMAKPHDVSAADWQEFEYRMHIDPNGLYFQYDVSD